jgi:hypothetical protein
MTMKASVAAILVLATFRQFYTDSKEAPLQTLGFILQVAAIWGLQMLDKAWEKDEQSKGWLPFKKFLQDENRRMNRIIRLDQGIGSPFRSEILPDQRPHRAFDDKSFPI